MASEEGKTIGEILLKKTSAKGVEFEAIFTTLLVTILLATLPTNRNRFILSVVAVLLLVILVFRWLAVNGRFANTKFGLSYTYRPLEFLSIIGVYRIVQLGFEWINELLPWYLNQSIAITIGSILIVLVTIVSVEFLQRTYRLWWGTVFYVKSSAVKTKSEDEEGAAKKELYSVFTNIFAQISYYLLRDSIPDGDHPELNDLRNFVSNVESKLEAQGDTVHPLRLMVFSGIIVFPIYWMIAWLLSLIFGPTTELFLVLIAVWVIQHMISFLYITNGASSFNTWIQPNMRSFGTTLLYTGVVFWIYVG